MEYRGFKIINEYKEPSPGAWRAYEIDNPECICYGRTKWELLCEINDVFLDRQDKEIDRINNEALKNSVIFETIKRHFTFMMSAMDEFMSREELRDTDTAEEYIEAAKFAETLGIKVRTKDVEEWIENELKK